MEFHSPSYLFLLIFIPLFFLWYLKKGKANEATLRFSSLDLIPQEVIRDGKIKNNFFIIFRLFIIFLVIVALSRPRIINSIKETKTEVIDILMVIDQSSSMLAQDFKPNRLEAAKDVAKKFIRDRSGDRLGLIVFAGNSYIQCPLTRDINVLLDFTDQIKIIDQENDGTAIGMAIANAINRLRDSTAKSKIIILLSDGSNNQGELDPLTAADLASQFDIKIYTVAAGSKGYAPYPVVDVWGREIIQKILVDVDEETLREIARITKGKFFRATDNKSLEFIYGEIDELERTEVSITEYKDYKELYSWFTIPAAFASVLFMLLSRGIFKKSY